MGYQVTYLYRSKSSKGNLTVTAGNPLLERDF
jgi:hypothetical protein